MNSSVQQPMIVKYVESLHNGIQSQALSRYAIGYILRGTKYIYDGISVRHFRAATFSIWASDTTTLRTSPKAASRSSRCSFITRPATCNAS